MMNIAFLGPCTDKKRFFLLCLARIMTNEKKAVIFSNKPYSFDTGPEHIYDYCGVEIRQFEKGEDLAPGLNEEGYYFLDIDRMMPVPEDSAIAVVTEPLRRNLEYSVKLAMEFSRNDQSLKISLIYLDIMEYCKVDKRYIDLFWEWNMPGFTETSRVFPFYFEEQNQIAMIECQFSERLSLKKLTPSCKTELLNVMQSLFGIEPKRARTLVRMAERMK